MMEYFIDSCAADKEREWRRVMPDGSHFTGALLNKLLRCRISQTCLFSVPC